jgi:hypothetical protein
VWTAIDAERPRYEAFDRDVAMWTAYAEAAAASGGDVEVVVDELGRPSPPATVGDLVARVFAGPVGVRPLAIDVGATVTRRADAAVDTVVLDRRDVLLVFGQVAPGLVSAPNPASTFAIRAPFTELQLAGTADDASVEEVVRDLIGEILFFQGNVVFVRTDPAEGGAAGETRLEVVDESIVDDLEAATEFLWGPADIEVAETLIDGVDVIVTLGTSYLGHRDARLADTASDTVADDDADDADDGSDADGDG